MSQKPVEVRVPPLGESITSAVVGRWLAKSGQKAEEGDTLAELETDKVTLEIPAPVAGKLEILKSQGEEVRPGEVLARLTGAGRSAASGRGPETGRSEAPEALRKAEKPPEPEKAEAEALREAAPRREEKPDFRPVRYEAALEEPAFSAPGERREPLSPLRLAIARNLRASQEEAAVLTTFNEVNMAEVQAIRARYREKFAQRHQGARLGITSFFARAAVEALAEFPLLNGRIEGSEIVHPASVNLGIAVGTDRGLVVPVIHGAESMGFAQLEEKIADFGARAKTGRLHLEELAGGSFTITNGGVFGSLLSTPLLNGRQSGVLGLHGIVDRPIARDGQVVIAPMMYIALSYDHRLVDGREAVTFLRRVKEFVEDPARLLLEV